MSKVTTRHASKGTTKFKCRTARACDRCRLKKAKCDGASRCKTCEQNDGDCTYTARRSREARAYYSQMREVMDEALQRLFNASYHNTGFPGQLPPHLNHPPSTNDILKALGLMTPELEDESIDTLPRTTTAHFSSNIATHRSISPTVDLRVAQNSLHMLPSLDQDDSPSSRPSSRPNQPASLPSAPTVLPSQPLDIQEQTPRMTSMSNSPLTMTAPGIGQRGPDVHTTSDTLPDMENFVNLALCEMPTNSMQQLSSRFNDMPDFAFNPPSSSLIPQLNLATDDCLATWPSTVAVTHQGGFRVR